MPLASFVRLRRAATAASALPALVEPGELVANTFARQVYIGDMASGTIGVPRALIGVVFHSAAIGYQTDTLVVRTGQIWRCKSTIAPKPFDTADWQQISGPVINEGVYHSTPIKTGTYTSAATDLVRVDTRASTVRVNLPASPLDKDSIRVTDVGGNFANNPCTVGRNGQLINGLASDYLMQTEKTNTFLFSTGLGWTTAT